jgi:hypothetical protein
MADADHSAATQQKQRPPSSPTDHPEGQAGETHFSLAVKSIFWLILLPVGILLLVRWLLQSNWLQP